MLVQLDRSGGTWPRPLHNTQQFSGDTSALESDLRKTVRGEVRFDDGSRSVYSTDGGNYRQIPIGVVCPRDSEDVIATVAACRSHRVPALSRGGGTSLAGQCCNTAVVMDMSKYMYRVIDIDSERKLGRAQPGCVFDRLRDEAARFGLTFGPLLRHPRSDGGPHC